jgi:hypothetical protein
MVVTTRFGQITGNCLNQNLSQKKTKTNNNLLWSISFTTGMRNKKAR